MAREVLPEPEKESEAAQLAAADALVQGESIWVLKTTDGLMRGEVLSACSVEHNGLELRSDCGRRLRIAMVGRTWRFECPDIEPRLKELSEKIVQSRLISYRKGSRPNTKTSNTSINEVFRTPSDAKVATVTRSLVWNPKKPKSIETPEENDAPGSSRAALGWRRIRLEFLGGREGSIQPVPSAFSMAKKDAIPQTVTESHGEVTASTPQNGTGSVNGVLQRLSCERRASDENVVKPESVQRNAKSFGPDAAKQRHTVDPGNIQNG
eukprot:gnl/MRDRNA2_/MRDRNA2_119874_c0_seq1.p1 gnl/MRDRNA2_/MRDRNA2_119874_c0~~gnl/MRDRNA2_/MRDRNA2_119874_c0_seq1.p1  ORF type:complete len:289 (-),score=41.28 gnl/MRDRNA2_/MRDRNA2_119874_c0_seq1:3-800(-)